MSSIFSLPSLFSTPRALYGERKRKLPFPLDPTHFVLTETCLVSKSGYSATALNTVDSEYATAYCVSNDIVREEGDAVWIERAYATIPATRTEQIGSYAYTFPGLASGAETVYTPSGYTGTNYTGPYTITVTSHPFIVGDKVRLVVRSVHAAGYTSYANALGTVSAVTTNTFTVPRLTYQHYEPSTITFMSATRFVRGAGQITVPSPAYQTFEYFLPGVSSGITTASDIVPLEVFSPFNEDTGDAVTTLSGSTVPTSTEYLTMLGLGTYLVAESVVDQYLGNILCRKTTYVRAQ